MNHPLAGQALNFEIELVEVDKDTDTPAETTETTDNS